MSSVPSIADSALSALRCGFARLDRGAAQIVAGSLAEPSRAMPQDVVELRSGSIVESEPMLAGVRDLMLARLQVGAGAALLHAYDSNRASLFEMLRDE